MKISRKLLFFVHDFERWLDPDEYSEDYWTYCNDIYIGDYSDDYWKDGWYIDVVYRHHWAVVLPDELKLPDDFNEDTDLPDGISRKLYCALKWDSPSPRLILDLVEAFREAKKNGMKKKRYETSYKEIYITDEFYSCSAFICFSEELEDLEKIKEVEYPTHDD